MIKYHYPMYWSLSFLWNTKKLLLLKSQTEFHRVLGYKEKKAFVFYIIKDHITPGIVIPFFLQNKAGTAV